MYQPTEISPRGSVSKHLSFNRYLLAEILEKSLFIAFFGYFCYKVIPQIDQDRIVNLILLLSEGVTAALVLFHRPSKSLSKNPGDWFIALSISFLPTFLTPLTGEAFAPVAFSLVLMLFGFMLQLVSKLYLFRSFGIVPANRGVRVHGPYAFIRHPIYAGYIISSIGFLSAHPHALNILIYSAIAALQIRRIFAEEDILSQDPVYLAYREQVRYRLLPGVF